MQCMWWKDQTLDKQSSLWKRNSFSSGTLCSVPLLMCKCKLQTYCFAHFGSLYETSPHSYDWRFLTHPVNLCSNIHCTNSVQGARCTTSLLIILVLLLNMIYEKKTRYKEKMLWTATLKIDLLWETESVCKTPCSQVLTILIVYM